MRRRIYSINFVKLGLCAYFLILLYVNISGLSLDNNLTQSPQQVSQPDQSAPNKLLAFEEVPLVSESRLRGKDSKLSWQSPAAAGRTTICRRALIAHEYVPFSNHHGNSTIMIL